MIKDPPGTNVIPYGFSGCHLAPLTPTSSPLSDILPHPIIVAKIAAKAINFFISVGLIIHYYSVCKPIYYSLIKQLFRVLLFLASKLKLNKLRKKYFIDKVPKKAVKYKK